MKRVQLAISLLTVVLVLTAIIFWNRRVAMPSSRPGNNGPEQTAVGSNPKNKDIKSESTPKVSKRESIGASEPARPELSPEVAPDANPMAASVAAALKTGQYPERLSPLVTPKPFDRAAFEKDPVTYCAVFEPGRVFQTMKATGPDSIHLKKITAPWVETKQGQPVVITVKGAPKSPITIISADGGYFRESHLNGITVVADDKGMASATYVADSGTTGNVRILAGSPMAVGLQNFVVDVNP